VPPILFTIEREELQAIRDIDGRRRNRYVLFALARLKTNDQRLFFYPASRKHRYRRRKMIDQAAISQRR